MRFCLPADGSSLPGPSTNTFAGSPGPVGIPLFVEWAVKCCGTVDDSTGYLVNIRDVDQAIRPIAAAAVAEGIRRSQHPAETLRDAISSLVSRDDCISPLLAGIRWKLTPFYHVAVERDAPDQFEMSHQYDFAAAHHLSCADLDDEANQALYGRCTEQHGHNYRVSVRVAVPFERPDGQPVLTVGTLDEIVVREVISPFDHTDLNTLPDFADAAPSVERIARRCYERLLTPLEAAGGSLISVRVWETSKTSCTYPVG